MNPLSPNYRKVPEWNNYYPSLSEATVEQRIFYKHWQNQVEKGIFIDIEGNLSYIFVYLYSVVQQFLVDKDMTRLLGCFEKIYRGYGEFEKINDYLSYWTHDAYLYLNDYDKAWKCIKGRKFDIADVMNFRAKCTDTSIDGRDLLCILGSDSGLTKFGKSHQDQIAALATIYLEDFHREHAKNLIEYFCLQFDFANLTENDFLKLKEFYPNEKDFLFWKDMYESGERQKYPYQYGHYLFAGAPINQPYITCEAIPYIITVALTNEGKRILRECENTLREEKNLPRVGEGWISETELFHRLLEAFPNERIVHHGRPAWLSPQHLDIYFPPRNIGLEYQGIQHQNPVEYCGGEDAFKKQQERDKRKSRLCQKNSCTLIYVYEGYDFEDIKQKIESQLTS